MKIQWLNEVHNEFREFVTYYMTQVGKYGFRALLIDSMFVCINSGMIPDRQVHIAEMKNSAAGFSP